jgi:hypothetical protein
MSRLLEAVPEAFKELVKEHQFSITEETYAPRSFGNAVLDLDGARLRLRLVRDRGQVWVDVGSVDDRNRLFLLSDVLALVVGGRDLDLTGQCQLLRARFNEIEQLFKERSYPTTLDRLDAVQRNRASNYRMRDTRSSEGS